MKVKKRGNKERTSGKRILGSIIFSFVMGLIFFLYSKKTSNVIGAFFFFLVLSAIYTVMKLKLASYANIKKMEEAFPDFLQLMSSNLRAGMTTDRALLMAARKEFYPLDLEILKLGKELMTGRKIEDALYEMGER